MQDLKFENTKLVSEANQAAIDDAHDQTLKNIAKMDNLTKTALDANKGALDAVRCYEPKSAVAGRRPAIRRRALPWGTLAA